MSHLIRFSVAAGGCSTAAEWSAQARRVEDLGYHTLTLADHLASPMAPLPALVAAAAATTTLRVRTMVLANDFRNPVVLAKEAATVDVLTDGRFSLGIGAGWMTEDYRSAGMAMDDAGTRIDRLAEAVTILKGAFRGDPFDHEGEHYSVQGVVGTPVPVQRPHPPLLIAGGRPRILALAGREADIVGLNPSMAAGVIDDRAGPSATAHSTDRKLAWIRQAAGDRFGDLVLQTRVHLAAISDDREAVAELVAPTLGITPADALGSPHALVGTVQQCVESVLSWRDRWGITDIGIGVDAMEQMAPVVARLSSE